MTSRINNWIDGYLAVRDAAYASRGAIELESKEAGARWPRTTGNDVVVIASVLDSYVRKHGSAGLVVRWEDERDGLRSTAVPAPAVTYLYNRSFWATFEAIAVFLDDTEVPSIPSSIWEALVAAVSLRRNAGPTEDGPFIHFDNIKTYDDLWNAQRAYLAEKRGADKLDPPDGFGGGPQPVPRTTNADVLQLATYWSQRLSDTTPQMGHNGVVRTWQLAIDNVDKLAKPGKPDDVYPKNGELWAASRRVAMQVAVSDEVPSKWSMMVSSLKDSIVALPKTVEHVAADGAELLARAANTAGRVAGEASKGLFSGMGVPLLLGAGLLGVYFVKRSRPDEGA